MNCEVEYCIYNRNFRCLLNKQSINALGMCEECIFVSLDRDFLEVEKERQLQEIESRWKDKTEE